MYGFLQVVAYLAVIIWGLYYYYFASSFDYWKKQGVKGPKPTFIFGNLKDVYFMRISIAEYFRRLYYKYSDEPMIGLFNLNDPYLLIKDPEYIKDVLIKDFSNFPDRSMLPNENVEPLSQHLFRLEERRWRPLRHRLSPVFTSGKLKEMFHLLLECSVQLEKHLAEQVATGEPIECRELTAKFTTDVIGSCAFGLEINSMSTEHSKFRDVGKQIFSAGWKTFLRERLMDIPSLYSIIGRIAQNTEVTRFFTGITKETIDYRIKNNVYRHDFVDMLVELKQHPEKLGVKELDDTFIAAQAFVFFAAGFETSSLTMTNALYELALNQEIQTKLREDIKNTLENTDGEITYESIKEMKYLHRFFQEVLRKYPPVLFLARTALSDYTFKGSNVHLYKGQKVFIPVYARHRDPEIYPNPEVFDPERFSEENIRARHPMYYLPFGDGPRNCIGARFANYQSKVGLIKILLAYHIDVCEKTVKEYVLNPSLSFVLQPNHDIFVQMTKIVE